LVVNNDTKWIIGAGVAVIASVVGTAMAVIAVVVTLVGGVREDLRDVREDMRSMQADMRSMHAVIEGLRDDMHAAIEGLRDDMREDHARFDARLDALEVAFGKVDQRLQTIERVVLPAPEAGE
jgi:Sec-independent protein translocase protein TatA